MEQTNLRKGYSGYLLTQSGRETLLSHVDTVHPDVVAHHVTHQFGVYESLPPDADHVRAIAVAQNDQIQAVIVKVNGTTSRDDGSFYHITVSLDRTAGAKPKDSNDLIRDSRNWIAINPFDIEVEPKFFAFGD